MYDDDGGDDDDDDHDDDDDDYVEGNPVRNPELHSAGQTRLNAWAISLWRQYSCRPTGSLKHRKIIEIRKIIENF